MNRADRKAKKSADKRARKHADMMRNGGKSKYARKVAYLYSHPREETRTVERPDGTVETVTVSRIPWGWEFRSPKPWQ